ncbi:MAG: dienelactone hydrolase family protein [Burkholderiaceae bacterium]
MGMMIDLKAGDGHAFKAYVAEPPARPRGGIVVVQEIFGVNSHIRSVADGYAADGYLTIAPALFDRVQRGYESGYTQPEIQAGIALMQKIVWDDAMKDAAAAVEGVKHAGKVGMVGYCWGGAVTWLAAARIPGLAAAVPYYGGAIPSLNGEQPTCPTMLHFGEADASIPIDKARAVEAAHPDVTTHFYAAGHGFNCDQRGSYDEAAAKLARERTLEFFRKHVG